MKTLPLQILYILLFCSGCYTFFEQDIELITQESPKIVLAGFLDPAEPVSIYVSRSIVTGQPYLYQRDRIMTDAVVRLRSEDKEFVLLAFDDEKRYYTDTSSRIVLEPGSKYFIEAEHPGYAPVSGKCTIPDVAPDSKEVTWQVFEKKYGDYVEPFIQFTKRNPVRYPYGMSLSHVLHGAIDSTEYRRDTWDIKPPAALQQPFTKFKPASIESLSSFILYYTDEHYFKYHRSLWDQGIKQDPFGEAIPIYSNIKGGLGVFCGVNGTIL